jgi:CMP-N,N'-diacetyllegionaminic acid synthase
LINNKRVLGLIPARAGSKGIPNKNMALLYGRPLIHWTIISAQKSNYIDEIIVSTDDPAIQSYALERGCKANELRPSYLATDSASSIDVIKEVLERQGDFDYVLLLQPTSPLRQPDDIDGCIVMAEQNRLQSLISVTESKEHPLLAYEQLPTGLLSPFVVRDQNASLRRQALPPSFRINGAIYLVGVKWFLENSALVTGESHGFLMPEERSIDIDTRADLAIAEKLLEKS